MKDSHRKVLEMSQQSAEELSEGFAQAADAFTAMNEQGLALAAHMVAENLEAYSNAIKKRLAKKKQEWSYAGNH